MPNRNVNPDPFKEIEPFIRDLKRVIDRRHGHLGDRRKIEVYLNAFNMFIGDFKEKHNIPDIDIIIGRAERRQALLDDTCSDIGNVLSSEFEEETME